MFRQILILIAIVTTFTSQAQEKKAYQFFDSKGKELSYGEVIDQLSKSEVLLFGEQHNNPVCHWLQLEVTMDLYALDTAMVLGAEMFESDDQLVLNEYFSNSIKERHFKKEAKLWNNYATDYKPLVEFAHKNNLDFIATNVPRRYASLVARNGVEGLNELDREALKYMAPLPFKFDLETPGYDEMMKMDMGHGSGMSAENFVKAQALKDATMAHFIENNFTEGTRFIHYQGDFHSKNRGGIYWYLNQANDKLKVMTISTVESDNCEWKEEFADQGDFILVIPSRMTKTY